LRLDQKWSTTL